MEGFYVSIIFLGIMLVVFSLGWIAMDRKTTAESARDINDKKDNLVEIINDAELMVQELNKFSDYIISRLEMKNKEFEEVIRAADDRIRSLKEKVEQAEDTEDKIGRAHV